MWKIKKFNIMEILSVGLVVIMLGLLLPMNVKAVSAKNWYYLHVTGLSKNNEGAIACVGTNSEIGDIKGISYDVNSKTIILNNFKDIHLSVYGDVFGGSYSVEYVYIKGSNTLNELYVDSSFALKGDIGSTMTCETVYRVADKKLTLATGNNGVTQTAGTFNTEKQEISENSPGYTVIKGNATFAGPIADKSIKWDIKKKNQTIFKTYGVPPFSLGIKLSSKNCKVSYSSNNKSVAVISKAGKVTVKGCGKATITISASGKNYKTATAKITIVIKPKKESITTISIGKSKSLKVAWKKDSKATGYQIQYSTDKKFKKKSTKNLIVRENKTTSKTINKLKRGKKYYVRVRAYKKVGNIQYYGSWSREKYKIVK